MSVPKNYSGIAFQHEKSIKAPPTLPVASPPFEKEVKCENKNSCENCAAKEKNPLTCLFEAFRSNRKNGFDNEDFLLLGLIALLLNKEGNEDIVLILAMLLLM